MFILLSAHPYNGTFYYLVTIAAISLEIVQHFQHLTSEVTTFSMQLKNVTI